MKKECTILRDSSLYVRNWANKQPSVKEESLTDWLLFNISSKTSNITYKEFTRHVESKTTGADWEWWFLFPNFSYKFRIQAKKTKTSSNNFPSITYPKGTSSQMDKLIKDALKNNAIPLYAFYTNKINKVNCRKNILDEGVYLTSAIDLKNKFVIPKIKKIDYDDILEDTIPISCLLCCDLQIGKIKGNPSPSGFDEFVNRYFNTKKDNNIKNDNLGRHSEIPNYVNSLMEFSKKELPEWWEEEYKKSIDGLNGIIVVDRRKNYAQQKI